MGTNLRQTRDFFDSWRRYVTLVTELDTYQKTAHALRACLNGRVLDVGSGRIVNYDTSKVSHLVLIDLTQIPSPVTHSETLILEYTSGDATVLPFGDSTFDVVLMQMLVHHLAGQNYNETRKRTQQAFSEARRVLKFGGRIVVVESTLSSHWELLERLAFPLFKRFLSWIGHPLVFQWTQEGIAAELHRAGFCNCSLEAIPLGRWIVQLGIKWPTALTPLKLYRFEAIKE